MGCGRRERGSTRPAPERRDRPRGQWELSRGECRLVHSHPLYSTVQPQAPGLEFKSPAVPILTRADAARAPPAALPGASSRNTRVRGQAGQRRVGAGRCARKGGSKPCLTWPQSPPPLRAELGSPPPRRLPRPAAARPARVHAPRPGRSAGSTSLGATASPWRRGGGGEAVARARRRRSPAPEVPPGAGTR